ncbi:acetyl-CoA carboxylase carboxyltransferase subunit alpha/beta [Nocardioides sp. TRM66260-LWL]|uniref:carboxyl transferase domain-containing protein n=1 Tax=Nocardioides sp. TRM66260-LWL TaxID=2874478 RepID=UPI001CC4B43F|nr:carboxyl transferase domain-containing protein [Nocardioides sp. TRM66260-LWL]MBZ5735719.1 acetyl-CoA carboxylase carboxyltransferase subunit alpha/beta [Nocardioides sp. TRM66260-LWL]
MTPPADRPRRLGAHDLVELVLDAGSWTPWDAPPRYGPIGAAYAADLAAARERSGVDEAVVTGEGRLRGRRVAALVGEFAFLAGSIGRATADRLVAAIERATAEGLPLVAAPVSGGTRMQEGSPAFVQMVRISQAVAAHKAAGLPYLVYLRNPTTGGVMASWGSLGHVTVAEPGALVGFLGPRVYAALYGEEFPEDVQTSENLYARGIIDAVVAPGEIGEILHRALQVMLPDHDAVRAVAGAAPDAPEPRREVDAWESVTRSRDPERPGVRRLLRHAATDVVPLNGTGQGETEPGLLIALVRFGDVPCVLLGQDRRGQGDQHPLGPGALREARRGMRLASELGLPLLTVIDTRGAALSVNAENGGLAGEIARCLSDLVTLEAPTLSLMLGEGNGGGALALLPADRVVAAEHAWLSPLPPEGASAIVHRDTDHAPELARAQRVRAQDLRALGIVDRIVAEEPDAAREPEAFCRRVGAVLAHELAGLLVAGPGSPADRARRYAAPLDGPATQD